jgi:tRNA pseudouridine55 synthase
MFTGTIEQVPPIFSAIRKGGKKLYQEARKGVAAEDIDIPSRHVEIYSINMVSCDIPHFVLDVECGGGTYIRSLVRDIGTALGSVATTTKLERTKQGQFLVADAIAKDDWSAENIYAAIAHFNQALSSNEG